MTLAQRHSGEALRIIERRKQVYEYARAEHPERWFQTLRNWDLQAEVRLNPERAPSEPLSEVA